MAYRVKFFLIGFVLVTISVSCVSLSNTEIKMDSFTYVKKHDNCFLLLVNEYFVDDTMTLICQDNIVFKDSILDTEKRRDKVFHHPFPQFGMTVVHRTSRLLKMIALNMGGKEETSSILSKVHNNLLYGNKRLINGHVFKINTVFNGKPQEFHIDVRDVKMVFLSHDRTCDTLDCHIIKHKMKYLE